MIQRILIFLSFITIISISHILQDMPHGDSFDLDCELCHATDSWDVDIENIKFDHNETGFPLLGAHAKTLCRICHKNLEFTHVGTACADCHTDIHKSELGFRCEKCHSPVTWENRQEIYEKHILTDFPLVGVHALLDCQSCHLNQSDREYVAPPVECAGCHLEDYAQTTNPDHQKAGFSLECDNCHLPNAPTWQQSRYYHPEIFPLSGEHAGIDCIDCHSEVYNGQSSDCYFCHKNEYENTTDPDHFTFGFPQNCESCHNISTWERTDFDHVAASGFELHGTHELIQCTSCHINNQISGLPRDCYGCHENDYRAAKFPDHLQAGFSQNCIECHSEIVWSPAEFDHNQTNYPLTGAHTTVDCADCHIDGQFAGLPSDCWSCHDAAYSAVNDPNHITNNFDHDCTQCHSTTTWSPATFNHSNTNFPLTGAHINVDCRLCHDAGYTNTPEECFACHDDDYNATTDPAHLAAQFPTVCDDCHGTSAWSPANWDHDGQYFPIYSGSHREAWNNCIDCHVSPSNYTLFECINCHEHTMTEMNEKHREVQDYSYDSPSCYRCHPDGKSED